MASEDLPANGHGGPADPKPALRRALRAARANYVTGLTTAERAALEASLATILAPRLSSGVVAGYVAIGGEIGVGHVARITLLPRVVGAAPLAFVAASGRTGRPDIVLVPLIAVDARGNRLGQGGGHYDRTLAALRAERRVRAVGVAWDMQCVDALPVDPWDAPLDAVATPTGWRDFACG